MAETLAAQLTRVQAAIARIENNAQATSGPERSIQFANLETLYARETNLQARISAGDGGRRTLAEFS